MHEKETKTAFNCSKHQVNQKTRFLDIEAADELSRAISKLFISGQLFPALDTLA
jgi:hypothetical protein